MRFVIAGNDLPATRAIHLLLEHDPQSLAGILTTAPRHTLPERLIDYPAILVEDAHMLHAPDAPTRMVNLRADWLISANSKVYIPPSIIDVFQGRVINVHPGLLPEYAGMYAYQWAIRNGEEQTGPTIHWVREGIDTGEIIAQRAVPIWPSDTGRQVQKKVLVAGARLLRQVMQQILAGHPLAHIPQDFSRRTFHAPEDARDGRIDWRWPARQVIDFIRAGNFMPRPSPSYTAILDVIGGMRVEIFRAIDAGHSEGVPGQWLALTPEGPVISCGDGGAVCLALARSEGERMSLPWWQIYRNLLARDRLAGQAPLTG